MKLPSKLNDGKHDYTLIREEKDLGNGLADVALYERVPVDPDYQYTPDLAFCKGQTTVPIMQKMVR